MGTGGSGDGGAGDASPTTLSGRLLLEVPVRGAGDGGPSSDEGAGERSAESTAEPAGKDDETGAVDDPWAPSASDPRAYPDVTLVPPDPDACRVRAWQGATLIGETSTCDVTGGWVVSLDASLLDPAAGPVSVELWVAERLRGVVDVTPVEGKDTVLDGVALGFGTELRGTVVDVRGAIVPNVLVEAMPVPDLGESIPWRGETDESGRFVIEAFPPGPAVLRIVHRDYALSVLEAVAPERDVLFRLEALYDIQGKVVLGSRSFDRVVARLEGSSVWPPLEVPVAADGSFVFDDVVDGVYGVEVIALASETATADGPPPSYASIPLENVTPDMAIDLALIPARSIPARVVDTDGQPVAGARVRAGYADVALLQRHAQTDASGRAQLGPLVPGPYRLHADADGFLPASPATVELGAGDVAPFEEIELVVSKPARLAGVVRDEDGRPVRSAEVVLEAEEAFMVGESAARASTFALVRAGGQRPGVGSLGVTKGPVPDIPALGESDEAAAEAGGFLVLTDDEGRFDIPMLPPGKYRLIARHGEHAASVPKPIELDSGAALQGVELVVRRGHPLTGRVRDGNGQPVEFASVELDDGTLVVVDDRGVFDVGYRRGSVKVIVRAPGFAPTSLEVEVSGKPVDLEIELEEAEGVAAGVVRDGNGQAIAAADVELVPSDGIGAASLGRTDDTGAFSLEGLADGRATVVIDHPEYLPQRVDVRILDGRMDELRVVLRRGWSIDVTVRERGSGRPVPGASVRAFDRDATLDAEGRGRLARLGERSVELTASADGFVSARVTVIAPEGALDPGARDDAEVTVVVELDQGGAIEGTIEDDVGDPVVGAELELWLGTIPAPRGTAPLATTRSGARGVWRFDDVPEGEVFVVAHPPRRLRDLLAPIQQETDVVRGEVTRDVALRFDRP